MTCIRHLPAAPALLAALVLAAPVSEATTGYYTWPSAFDDTLVFSAEGDLWRLDEGSDQATRLTTHEETESQAVISPDGEQVAFLASYDGIRQAYVMPVRGGTPRQLTFEPEEVQVRGWSPDGRVLYTSRGMEGTSRVRELRLVDPDTLAVERLPLRYATTGTFGSNADILYFVRNGVEVVGDNVRLYRGGGMAQLWRYETGADAAQRLAPDFDGPIENPMFWHNRIYFISDQSGDDNIWSMNEQGGDLRQESDLRGWRINSPQLQDGRITYHKGADIYRFDLGSRRERLIEIDLATDRETGRERWISDPMNYLDGVSLGDDNSRLALSARGAVTLVGNDTRRRIDLPIPADTRARSASLDAAGEWVYVILDAGERGEIWRFAADGSDRAEQITYGSEHHIWNLRLSDDGKWLVYHDKLARLWKLSTETLDATEIFHSGSPSDNDFTDFSFSPDGRYMAFRTTGTRTMGAVVMVHDFDSGAMETVTTEKYVSTSPAFSADGKWLYFLSERNFEPTPSNPWGDRNMGVSFDRRTQLFALALTGDERFPFTPPDELDARVQDGPETEEEKNTANNGESQEQKETAPQTTEIDWDAASGRLYQLPVPAGNYGRLTATSDRLYLQDGNEIKTLAIGHDDPELKVFASRVSGYGLSADRKVIVMQYSGSNLAIVPAREKAPDDLDDASVRTRGWRVQVDAQAEWQQMFLDAWRLHRDFAYDPTMRSVDWNAVRDKLEPLAVRLGHRNDLSDLLAQMAYELGILHSQVRGGDMPSDRENPSLASLGARYEQTDAGLRIAQIYQGDAERPSTLGPLTGPDRDIAVGDIIVAINNQPVRNQADLEETLMQQNGERVLLETRRAGERLQHVVTPVPFGAESNLRYLDWAEANARKVAEAGDGNIGYLHLQAMGGSDLASFARDYYAQNQLDGLIIDVRDNNGGNVDSLIINQFLRQAWAFWNFRPDSPGYGNMQEAYRGHLAVLINAGTYSDGESFAAGIKALELAPLIGERTAGAGIWLSSRNGLVDGGMARVAENPQFGLDGRWLIEGRGVSPDIEVVAEPHALFNGEDAQLQAAVDYLQQKIIEEPVPEFRPLPLPPLGEPGLDIID